MSCNSSDPARPRAARGVGGGGDRPLWNPPGSVVRPPRGPALPLPSPCPPSALPGPGRGAGRSPPPRPPSRRRPTRGSCVRPAPLLGTRVPGRAWRGGRAAVRTSLLKVFTASMLSAQKPGARRRKRRRLGALRAEGRATGPGGRGARRAGDAPQRRRGPGMAAGRAQRAGLRPPGRVGGGGGAGAAPSLLLRPARKRPPHSSFGPLHSPPPSPPSSSSHGLLCHLPAA